MYAVEAALCTCSTVCVYVAHYLFGLIALCKAVCVCGCALAASICIPSLLRVSEKKGDY